MRAKREAEKEKASEVHKNRELLNQKELEQGEKQVAEAERRRKGLTDKNRRPFMEKKRESRERNRTETGQGGRETCKSRS